MRLSGSNLITASRNFVYCKVEDEMVLLGLEDGIYYGLNAVGSFIWDQIQQPKTIDEVRDAIIDEYDVKKDECENDLIELLYELIDRDIVIVEGNEKLPN